MKRIFTLIFVLGAMSMQLFAQDETPNFKPLQIDKKLPKEFVTEKSKLFKNLKVDKNTKSKKQSKEVTQFQLESAFQLGYLLQSGLVLGDGDIYNYLNEVLGNVVLDKKIKQKIKIYPFKSNAVNAFTTSEGYIFVSLGLISQLENEAQLAFIIAHEVEHYKQDHHFEEILESKSSSKYRSANLKDLSEETLLIEKLQYSKDIELEADSFAFIEFAKTQYSLDALAHVYDVLKFAHTPFDFRPFNFELLESKGLTLPDHFKLNVPLPHKLEESEDDLISSHPSIPKRKANFESWKSSADVKEGAQDYLLTEERFKEMRELCHYEILRTLTLNRRYEEALYHASLIYDIYGDSEYLQEKVGNILYSIGHYAAYFEHKKELENRDAYIRSIFTYSTHYDFREAEGYLSQVVYLTNWLYANPVQAVSLALNKNLEIVANYPEKKDIYEPLVENLVKLLAQDLYVEESYFDGSVYNAEKEAALKASFEESLNNGELSKYDKIYLQDEITSKAYNYDFEKNALKASGGEFKLEKWFKEYHQEKPSSEAVLKNKKNSYSSYYQTKIPDSLKVKSSFSSSFSSRTLDEKVNSVVVFKPEAIYYKLKNRERDYFMEDEVKSRLNTAIVDAAKKTKMKVKVLDPYKIRNSDEESFNDYALLFDYISNRYEHPTSMNISNVDQARIEELRDKYNTDYIYITGLIGYKNKKYVGYRAVTFLYPPLWYWTFKSADTYYTIDAVVNLKDNTIMLDRSKRKGGKPKERKLRKHFTKTFKEFKE